MTTTQLTARDSLLSAISAVGAEQNQGMDLLGLGDNSAAALTAPAMRLAGLIAREARGVLKPDDAAEVYRAFLAGRIVGETSAKAGASKVRIQIAFAQVPGADAVWEAFRRHVMAQNKPMTGVYEAWLAVVRKAAATPLEQGNPEAADEIVTGATTKATKSDDEVDVAALTQMEKRLTKLAGDRIAFRDDALAMVSKLKAMCQNILAGKVERPDATPDFNKMEQDIQAAQSHAPEPATVDDAAHDVLQHLQITN